MELHTPLRGGLFVFECARFSFLTGILAVLRPGMGAAFPWLVFAVPHALFLLMTLFLWLDFSRYSVYRPLYISGKCLSIFSVMGWFVFSRQPLNEWGVSCPAGVLIILFCGDLISAVAAVFIRQSTVSRRTVEKDETAEQGGK